MWTKHVLCLLWPGCVCTMTGFHIKRPEKNADRMTQRQRKPSSPRQTEHLLLLLIAGFKSKGVPLPCIKVLTDRCVGKDKIRKSLARWKLQKKVLFDRYQKLDLNQIQFWKTLSETRLRLADGGQMQFSDGDYFTCHLSIKTFKWINKKGFGVLFMNVYRCTIYRERCSITFFPCLKRKTQKQDGHLTVWAALSSDCHFPALYANKDAPQTACHNVFSHKKESSSHITFAELTKRPK